MPHRPRLSTLPLLLSLTVACSPGEPEATSPAAIGAPSASAVEIAEMGEWKDGAVCYEIFVRSFFDSDGDGVGDLNGLIEKLDYINDGDPDSQDDLGASCVWLMPVAQSPSYHGYDVTDYYRIDNDYGTNEDFRRLVAAAHERGIAVLVDLVLNHASSEHPYFKHALRNTDSPYRDWFIFRDRPPEERSPWDSPIWHRSEVRDEYYYGLFWGGMPDLNYENDAVMEEAKRVARHWLDELGADGFRLDAVKHLVEEPGVVQHAEGTHDALREFGGYVRDVAPASFTIGEVWDSIGAMLPYYPDQLDSHFAFETADAIVNAVRSGSAEGLLPPFLRLQREVPDQRWSPFLRNHDQTRTMTELGGDFEQAKLAATLLLTMPGIPFVYYGEEIGMTGDKPDPRIRTPMHWERRPGVGFTEGLAWEPLQPDSLTANVEAQTDDPESLLTLYRQLIHVRDASTALGSGDLAAVSASAPSVAAYLRVAEGGEAALVIANLGPEPASGVTLSAEAGSLEPGAYRARNLLGGPDAAGLEVGADGGFSGWVAYLELGPRESRVLELSPSGD